MGNEGQCLFLFINVIYKRVFIYFVLIYFVIHFAFIYVFAYSSIFLRILFCLSVSILFISIYLYLFIIIFFVYFNRVFTFDSGTFFHCKVLVFRVGFVVFNITLGASFTPSKQLSESGLGERRRIKERGRKGEEMGGSGMKRR
jgi:hypothetical protein